MFNKTCKKNNMSFTYNKDEYISDKNIRAYVLVIGV